jgi:hypothetical protein
LDTHRSPVAGRSPGTTGLGRSVPRTRPFLTSLMIAATVIAAAASPVAAARGGGGGSNGGGGGGGGHTTDQPAGNDISWPQCGRTFPSGQTFGIVGVNDGLANTLNPCLGPYRHGGPATSELVWALGSSGSSVPRAALYVNTADPGPGVADWPTDNVDPLTGAPVNDPDGTCDGSDSTACAWQYGWDRAVQDVAWLRQAATAAEAAGAVGVSGDASAYPWWLDVETANSWETGTTSPGFDNNVADLQGMVAALEAAGAQQVGIYSTSYQWGVITGGSKAGNLNGLDDWIPGASTQTGAIANCSLTAFTGGSVPITQWFGKPYDGDWAC